MKKNITVLVVEDHAVVCAGLRLLLEAGKGTEVIGEAFNGRDAVRLAEKLRPDVVLMDIGMPLLNGFEATRQIVKAVAGTKVLILSAHSDIEYVKKVIALGASGYLIKQSSSKLLVKAISDVSKGELVFSPSISKALERESETALDRSGVKKKKNIQLSSREAEVLQLIAEGEANKQIAAELKISIKTVEKHRQNLMEKLNIHDTAGLTRHAISTGVIE